MPHYVFLDDLLTREVEQRRNNRFLHLVHDRHRGTSRIGNLQMMEGAVFFDAYEDNMIMAIEKRNLGLHVVMATFLIPKRHRK